MGDNTGRCLEALSESVRRIGIVLEHFAEHGYEDADEFIRAASDTSSEAFERQDFLVHQLDLATEGVRLVRDMGRDDILDHIDGLLAPTGQRIVNFINLHRHVYHSYSSINYLIVWNTIAEHLDDVGHAIARTILDYS